MPPSQKVDLHVHTPASSDYLGQKTDGEYISILKECRRAGVSALAITDHNTVNGCIAFERLKGEAQLNYELNSRRGMAKESLDQIKDEVLLFESISVIHGVEISVYPKIHLILLFDDEVKLERILQFLKTDLDLQDAVDRGSSDAYFKQSPTQLLKLASAAFGDHFFCILPHVDSTNGVWDELSGDARADLFRAPEVLAVQVISPDTKRHFLQNVFHTKEYSRKPPLQILQASDFHGGPAGEIARQFSDLETGSRITFAALRQHFLHQRPIKISSDFIEETYKEIVKEKAVVGFDFQNGFKVDEQMEVILRQALCATINTPDTLIEFNVRNASLAPSDTADQIAKLVNDRLIPRVDPPSPCGYRISDLSHSPARQRFIFEATQNTRLRMCEGRVHVVANKKVTAAGAREVEQAVVRNFYNRFGRRKQRSLSRASQRVLMVSNSFPALATAYRTDQLIDREFTEKLAKGFESPSYSRNLQDCVDEANGLTEGDFYLLRVDKDLNAGRLSSHYLRFTAPTFAKKDVNIRDLTTITAPENSILAFPDGGVHIIRRAGPVYAPFPVLLLTAKSRETPLGPEVLPGLAVFLKSSFLLWYLVTIHETDDLFSFLLNEMDRLPIPSDPRLLSCLADICKQVIAAEEKILKELAKPKLSGEAREEIISHHNKSCNNLLRSADSQILKALRFSEAEIRELSRALKDLRLCDYNLADNLDQFLKDTTAAE
jgi:hypothetical protein